jgi:hypothetical protein
MLNTNSSSIGAIRPRQRDRLLALLAERASAWVPLPDILALGIAQYNARIFELRSMGHRIESKQEGDRSWFRLVTALASTTIPEGLHVGPTIVHEPPPISSSPNSNLPSETNHSHAGVRSVESLFDLQEERRQPENYSYPD